jgi:hypothetical protein
MSNARGYNYADEEQFKSLSQKEKGKVRSSVIEMRRDFAKLIRKNPSAFHICANEYQAIGEAGFPSSKGAGRPEYPHEVLAYILAKYENRNRIRKTTKQEFCENEIKSVYWTEFRFHKPNSAAAVEDILKRAKKLKKEDPLFAELTAIYLYSTLRGENYSSD